MSFEGGWIAFGPYACLGQAYATDLAAIHFEQQKKKNAEIEQAKADADAKVKEMEAMMFEKDRRIEELKAAEGKLRHEKDKLEKRNLTLAKKVEGLESRVSVMGDRRRLKIRTEQEIFPVIQHMDRNVKTSQAANAELQQRLDEASKANKELEANMQDLQRRLCEAAEKKHVSAEEPKGAGKEKIGRPMELDDYDYKKWQAYIAYILSSACIADWREEAAKESTEVEEVEKVRVRRFSEPPRPDVVFDECEAKEEEICAIHAWQEEGLPPMTDRKQAKLRIELFEGTPEVVDLLIKYDLHYGLWYCLE